MANPTFNTETLKTIQLHRMDAQQSYDAVYHVNQEPVFTIGGAIGKVAIFLGVTIISAAVGFVVMPPSMFLLIGMSIAAVVAGGFIAFKPHLAKSLGFAYAVMEGLVIGLLSRVMESAYDGIIVQAALAVIVASAVMLALYGARIITVTAKFRSVVTAATVAVAVFYLVNLGFSLMGIHLLTGTLGLVVSAVVVVIACFNLLLDFDTIERAAAMQVPANIEWYAAYGVLVTLIWMYIEMLRLIARMRD